MSEQGKALGYYTATLEENTPTTHRLTIEAFSLDPGTNLAEVGFAFAPPRGRHVTQLVNGRVHTVGLWRIVSGPAQ